MVCLISGSEIDLMVILVKRDIATNYDIAWSLTCQCQLLPYRHLRKINMSASNVALLSLIDYTNFYDATRVHISKKP